MVDPRIISEVWHLWTRIPMQLRIVLVLVAGMCLVIAAEGMNVALGGQHKW